jgi:hypothetical protein
MAKGTAVFIILLSFIAVFLLGINLGRNTEKSIQTSIPQPSIINYQLSASPTYQPAPTINQNPVDISTPSGTKVQTNNGISTYTDKTCGFSFSYPGSYMKQQTVNQQSVIFTDPNDPNSGIAATCASEIPRPPLPSDKIEAIIMDKIPANLYHDQNSKDGSPRDEIIVRHPINNMEIIIAGYGQTFQKAISSFRFIQ